MADLARGVAAGYRARPRFPLSGADHSAWVQAAEQYGFAERFAASTLDAGLACRVALPPNSYLVVEVSGSALLSPQVSGILAMAKDLTAVVLELTSLAPDRDHVALQRALEPIRKRGALLAVRATGGGHVGLLQLIELAPEFVNVDSELVAYIDQRPRHAATVAAIGGLAGEIDAWLLADGVRRVEEIGRLRELKVPLARGPLIGGETERMIGLAPEKVTLLRSGLEAPNDNLTALTQTVRALPVRPQLATETTVVVDENERPLEVIVPGPGKRTRAHPAMCVQCDDEIKDVALRASSRASEDQLAPVCLVDESGHLVGLIPVEALLRSLARA